MALWTDLVKPVELTGVGRSAVSDADNAAALADIFPSVNIQDVAFSWAVNGKSEDVAQFRAFDAESAIGGTSALEQKTVRLPALSLKKRFGELDSLVRMSANSPESVTDAANRLAVEVAQSFVRALVPARAEALITGKLSIVDDEGGFRQNVDFGRRVDHTVNAATPWDQGGDPVADLETWAAAFQSNTGYAPTKLKMSRAAFSALTRSKALAAYFSAGAPGLVSRDTVNAILGSYGLPQIEVVAGTVNGKEIFSKDHVVLAADGAGLTPWGLTKNAQDSRYGIAAGDMPGLVVAAYKEDDPAIEWIIGNASVVPVLANPDLTLAAKVTNI